MFTEPQIKFSNKKETDPSDFEDLVQTFLNMHRMSKTRFFIKHGIAYLSENGVVKPANLLLHQLRMEISFNPNDVNKAKFEALRRFIEEEQTKFSVASENKELESLTFDEKLERLSENKLIERTILFWRDRSTISLQEILDNSEECIEQIVLGQLYKAELSKIFPNFIANYKSVMAKIFSIRDGFSFFRLAKDASLEERQVQSANFKIISGFIRSLLGSMINRVDLELFQGDSLEPVGFYPSSRVSLEEEFLKNLKDPGANPIIAKKTARGEYAQDVILDEVMKELAYKRDISNFFEVVIGRFNPYFREAEKFSRALDHYEPDTKEKNFNSIWQDIKKAESAAKFDLLKKFIAHEGSEYVLFHLFELNISSQEEKEVILYIAQTDPTALLQNVEQLDLDEWRTELFEILSERAPLEFLSRARELNLGEHELEKYIDKFVEVSPITFLETYSQLFNKHYFPEAKKREWTVKLEIYLDSIKEPADILIALGSIDVYADFPELQEKIDRKVRNAFKILSYTLYTILVEASDEAEKDETAKNSKDLYAVVNKTLAAWGCLEYYRDFVTYVDLFNLSVSQIGEEKLSGFYVEEFYDQTRSNSRFGMLELVLERLKAGKSSLLCWEGFLAHAEKKYDQRLLEDIYATLLSQSNPENLLSLIKIIEFLPITKTEKEGRYKQVIDTFPIEIIEAFVPGMFSEFSDNVRLYFIEVLLKLNPHCLAENYYKIALKDKEQETRIFKDIIKRGIQPFAQIKEVNVLLPLLRTASLSFMWADGSTVNSQARENLLQARGFLSEKTWNFLLAMARENERCLAFFQNLTIEQYKILDEIILADDELAKFIFETSEGKKELRNYDRLLLVPFFHSSQLPIWRRRIAELNSLNDRNDKKIKPLGKKLNAKRLEEINETKRRENKIRAVTYGEVDLLLSVSLDIPIKEAHDRVKPFRKFLDLRTFNPRLSTRSQFDFVVENNARLDVFFERSVVASDKNRILELILKSDNPERKLEFLEKLANDLDCPVALWEQLAILSKTLLLEEMSQHVFVREPIPFTDDSYMWTGIPDEERERLLTEGERKGSLTWIPGIKFSPEQMRCLVANRLRKIFEISREPLEAATQRNREFADSQLDGLVLPVETLLHFSDNDSAGEVLRLGNLCGECLGIKSGRDSFPYHVDTFRVQENIPERDIASVLNGGLNYHRELLYIYPFRKSAAAFHYQEEFRADSSYLNHHLIFGALPRTELGGIVIKNQKQTREEKADLIENLKMNIAKNDIYIPIFDHNGRLLFTYEEFQTRWQELKPVSSVEKFLATDSLLDHLDFSGGGGHRFTVKEHSLKVEAQVMAAAERKDLPQRLQTIMRVAARLHDSGKKREGIEIQEISNVESAREMLDQIRFLKLEDKRQILKFIRNDELLGDVLKEMMFESGKWHLDKAGREKLKRFKEIFVDEQERQAMIILYEADVKSIGGEEYNQWMVEEKLKELGFI